MIQTHCTPAVQRYQLGDVLMVRFKKYEVGKVIPAIVIGIRRFESQFSNTINYVCEPSELQGYEHDDQEEIPGCHDSAEFGESGTLPWIIGRWS
jgi:hypothetical protein